MMNISVILSFLLCWSFVSPNPHHEKSNDKSVGESNHINDGSDTLTLGKEYSDEPSSGKDWGGDFFNFLNFFNHKDLDNDGKIYQADNKSFLDKLIYQGSNFFKTLIPKSKSSDNSLFDNIITWVQKNVETVGKLFTNKDNNLTNDSEIEESASIDEKIEKHSDRAKRDLRTSNSGLLWANPHKGGISEHLLKLSEGSSNVLKSEKATVAESLNGRAAISKILARAKAKAAKAAQYKNLYDNDDFRKWLLSGSSFDTNIFKHPFRLSHNTKITDDSETENTDNQHIFSESHHVSKPTNHEHHREIKHTLPNSTALGIADTDRSYTKLSRKSEHQKHLSSKLQSTSGEKHGRDTNEMLHKPTVSRHTHGLSSYEDEEDTGLRHTSSHADAPHVHFRITKDQETGNNIPKRKHAKWTHTDSSRAHASHASHSAESYEFETSDERERYGRKFIFKTSYKPGEDEEKIYTGHRKGHKFSEEINIHEGDKTNYDHLASSLFQHGSSIDPHHEKNIKNRNKQNLDGIQYSTIHSTTSTETKEGIEKKQSGNMLITKISTGVSTRHTKPVNIDIEHYHSRDQGVAANSATSFSSSLSDNKENKRTNNVLASPSVDDGSATVGTKTENDYGALGRTHSVIDNDVTSTGIEMGFSGIESHPPVDSSLAHSSLSHVHSKTHLGNQKVHHSISGYERSTVASETKHLMDAKTLMESQNKDHDLKANKKITTNVASSTETIPSIMNEHHHRIVSSDEEILDEEVSDEEVSDEEVSDEENYMKARKKYMDLKGKYINHARHKTSIEVIDIDDDSAEVLIPEFPVHKHGKAHVLHDINYYDFDGEEISDNEKIESAEDLKRIQNNYDNLEEKEKFTDNTKVSKESQMIISNERLSHDRHSQHRKNDKHNQHKYRSHHNKQNRHKNNNQYNHHSTYNQHKYHSQDNHHVLDEQANNMKSSSTASDATEFDTLDKYIYFIQKHGRRNTESNASFESSIKEGKKQNNAKHEKILLLNKKGRKYISDEDKHHYLKKHTNLSGPDMHSIEINKITSTNNNEKEIKSENNTKNRSKVVTRVESLIPDGSTIDTSHMKHNNKKISNNNKNYSQASWELMSLKNSRADVQTETEGVDDTYGGNENVDIKTKQTAKTAQSTESKSNIQSASSKTSESDNTKKIVAMIEQASDEKISSSSITSGYQNYDNEISGSSKLTAKSQMDTIRHSNKKLENTQEINANVGTLTKLTSLNDKIDKSRSNIQNAIASSKSSTKSQIGFWDYWNNKKYNTNAKASADAISVGVKNKQKSVLGNTSTFSKLSANSEESKKYSNDLKNAIGTAKSEALSGAANKSSIEPKMKTEQKSNHSNSIQGDANIKISSTATSDNEWLFLPSRMSQSKTHLTNNKNNQINSISEASAESMLLNVVKDKNRSQLQKSLSSSSVLSSEKSQAEYEHNNLQKNKIDVSTAKVPIQSTAFNNNDKGYWSDSSKSSLPSKWLKEKHIKNKHYSDNKKVNHEDNVSVATEIGETSSGIVRNSHQQESVSSLSSSPSSAKSQILNKNTKITTTSNNAFDMDEHNLWHASSSSQTAKTGSKNNLNIHKNDPQTANTATLTISALNNDKYRREDNILKAKWLTDLTNKNNIEKFSNNKINEKDEIIKPKSENALNAQTSVKTITSTDIKNGMKASSSSNSKAKSWTHNERDLNQLKKGKIIINDLVTSKISNNVENNHKNKLLATSSLSNLHNISEEKKNHMNIMENNQRSMATVKASSKSLFSTNNRQSHNDLVKETTLSEISDEVQRKRNNMLKDKFKDIASKITMEKISNSANKVYHNNLLKDTSVISNKKIQTSNKIKDENGIYADNSGTENQINSRRIKYLKENNNANEISTDLATLNNFNSENQNNILKVTLSNNLYGEMLQKDQHKSDILSDINRIANTNIQDKHRHELISSTDTKIQSMIDHKSDILRKKEAIKSETHNNINKWNTKFQTTISSSSNAESQNRENSVVKTVVSAESTANNVNKDAYDSMQEKSAFNPSNIAKVNKQYRYGNQKANVANIGKIRAGISNSQRFIEHFKDDAKEKTQQNKLKHQKTITSNIELLEGTNSSEMENAHQELLKDVTASNSRAKVQHEHISDIVKESLKVTGSAATKSSEKVESKSQEKLVRDSAKSNSYAKSQIKNKNDLSASKGRQIIPSIKTLANSAIFNNFKNSQQNKLNKNLLSDLEFHNTYTRNENRRKILKNNLANTADLTVSAKEASSNIIKDKYQSGIKTISNEALLSNSYAEMQTDKRGYNSNLQRRLIQTTSSNDMKKHIGNKNTANNEENLKAATNIVTSATSSNSIESTSTQDLSKILSSSSLYTASQMDNVHSRNVAQDGQKGIFTVTQALPTSLVTSTSNQDKQNEILHIQDSKNQRITKTKNKNNFLRKVYDGEDTAVSRQATSFSNIKNEHQNNLLKASLINSFADTQSMQKDESSIRSKQHLITTDSIASSDSNISGCMDSIHKNDLEKLIGISSSNSYSKSNAQNKNHIDILKKKHKGIFNANRSGQAIISSEFKDTKQDKLLRMTSSSNSYTETKNDNTNSIKKALDATLNAKIKTIPLNNIKNIHSHGLVNAHSKMLTENENIFQKNVMKNSLSETSSDLFSKAQIKSAHDSVILKDDCKNSATANTIIKTKSNNHGNQHEDLHKTRFLSSSAEDNQHNIKSILSENSYVTIPAINENIVKSGKAKKDEEVIFNLSTLGKMKIHNKIKKEHLNNWPITTSDIATLAEERTENKDKFNDSKTTEKVAVYTGTSGVAAATNNIESEQHDIHVEDRNKLEDSWNTETKIRNAILDTSAEMIALKEKNKSERKSIFDNKLATALSNEAQTKTQIINKGKYGVMDNLESSVNTEETQHSITSAMSSASASSSSNMNTDLGTKYDQINNKMSTTSLITSVSKDIKGSEKDLSSDQTSLHLADKINRCKKDVETREFISQATNLYKMVGKQQDSEILLLKRNSKGSVQIASFKNSVPPLIAYRLIPREVYERIRTILVNKQIFCTDCPLSNS